MPKKLWLLCLIISVIIALPKRQFFGLIFIILSWVMRFILSHCHFNFPASEYEELPEEGWPSCFLMCFYLTTKKWLTRLGTLEVIDLIASFATYWVIVGTITWLIFKLNHKT